MPFGYFVFRFGGGRLAYQLFTVYINKKLDAEHDEKLKAGSKDASGATVIEAKEVKDVE